MFHFTSLIKSQYPLELNSIVKPQGLHGLLGESPSWFNRHFLRISGRISQKFSVNSNMAHLGFSQVERSFVPCVIAET